MKFGDLSIYLSRLESTTKRLEMFDILSEAFSKVDKNEIGKAVYFIQGEPAPSFYGIQIGMADKIVEKAISMAYVEGIEKVKTSSKKIGDLGEVAEKLDKQKSYSNLTITAVYDSILKLSKMTGEGSTEEKINELAECLKKVAPLEAKYIVRFVLGKLRLGIGNATIMEALSKAKTNDRKFKPELEKAFNLCSDLGYVAELFYSKGEEVIKRFQVEVMRPIRPALAERLNTPRKILEKLGRCALDQKFDGFRAQVHKEGDKVKVFSRNLEDITSFMPEIVEAVRRLSEKTIIFDSEALSYDEDTGTLYPFQVTIHRKRKHDIEEASQKFPLRLFVFDVMFLNGKSLIDEPYTARRETVERIFKDSGSVISPSKIIITDKEDDFIRFFDETISSGLEGVVAKRLSSGYSAGARNFNWIKIKRSYKSKLNDTIDVVILGYFRGRGSRARFGIGAILAGVYDERTDTFKTITKVGSGFSEDQLKQMKSALDSVKVDHKPARVDSMIEPDFWVQPEYVITVKADEITNSPIHTAGMENGVGYALRFPRAVSFIRADKNADDANTVKEIKEMFKQQKTVKI
ncbi:ATP-dependent DNA ligase [Candidatus Parvarchaeota archaeon]|nr:ATP-dependent DNA ligase [Candidatus Parvarchaeota archaeon]